MENTKALVATRCPNPLCGRPMVQRPAVHQTPEQAFCGAWWDCTYCRSAVLFPSQDLTAQLNEMRGKLAVQAARQDPSIKAGFEAWITNACYWDGNGYRMKDNKRGRASWSKAVMKLYADCDAFHEAAHAFAARTARKAVA